MSRLYGLRSTHPRKVECELIRAHNTLITRSLEEGGEERVTGWGLGLYQDGEPTVDRQVLPATDDHEFRVEAAQRHTTDAVSHVRRANAQDAREEDTQPFDHEGWLFAHHGVLEAFDQLRDRMREAMVPEYREAIRGESDSEHLFFLVLSVHERKPELALKDVVRRVLHRIIEWSAEAAPGADLTANLLWTDGSELVATRFGRPLWFVKRDAVHPCGVHEGARHVQSDPGGVYRAVVLASRQMTSDEEWTPVPDRSVVTVDAECEMGVEVL